MRIFVKIKSSRKFPNLQYSYFVSKISLKLCMVVIACFLFPLLTFFPFFSKYSYGQEHYQSVKQFGSKSGWTFCGSLSWAIIFCKHYQMTKNNASKEFTKKLLKLIIDENWLN